MKSFFVAAIAGTACVRAQNITTMAYAPLTTSITTSYSLSTWTSDDCTSLPDITLTSTDTLTVTYCSDCEHMTMGGNTIHTTVYTTVFSQFCPGGTEINGSTAYMTPQTYTITESCSMPVPSWSSNSAWVPQSYTTEVQVCHVCGEKDMTATITFPASCTTYPAGVTAASSPMPASTATTTSCTETTPAPVYKFTSVAQVTVTSGVAYPSDATPAVWGNTTGITSYAGGASTLSVGWFVTLCSIACMAAGALLL